MSRFYLTTAIDYSNGDPHIGHAYEKVGADVIARFHRLAGEDVHYVIGMDEHGQKVAQEAAAQGRPPQELVDDLAARFQTVWDRLSISHDDFIRTTEPRHRQAVQALVRKIRDAGDLYRDRYEGYYCTGCEAFKREPELEEGRCPIHPSREIAWTEEENWFFRLSAYRDRLIEHIEAHPEFIEPESRRNEILRLLEGGLEDISASRSRVPWGVPFPDEEGHTVYVWFDALPNYISAIGFPGDEFHTWWPAGLHVIGKDITRFHCVIWPAMLLSAGLELPRTVWGHGFVKIGGGKLSKSEARLLDLDQLIDRHGPDAFRYFLLREIPWDRDRDFPSVDAFLKQFDERYNADLANDLGNLLNRTVSMSRKYRDGIVRRFADTELDAQIEGALDVYEKAMADGRLHEGLDAAMSIVRAANGFIDTEQPWKLAREPESQERLDDVLAALVRGLGTTALMLEPFIPGKAVEMWQRLGGSDLPLLSGLSEGIPTTVPERWDTVLFPRVDLDDRQA
ncbi:MAG: class I tRNA ligase family protein [marine benthic group bacterium]|nr:class I tRNA ligase family protein [Candidatus Benthicola marisminoris]